ncbi:ExbD/TolR family protein [Methylogaea oryzae]|uniref:Biopolymer transporter ExbD n=1 Tax=Methylogaea oryzae TaxID=1295382 RepID=A0A8D5ALP4_9GAMM|nr:biopolymer transporter ExbD [Methylogaea oryzae]BBL72346.1 biopolymer transporter ExbD [Methylogaea oryzae]
MAFKTESSDEAMAEINVTPLVDVMLVLLVVFIVTAPLLTQAVHVNLPKTEQAAPAPEKHLLTVSIDAQGGITVNEQATALEALGQRFSDQLKGDPETTVQFHADTAVPYGKVAQVMALAQHAGITKLAFITQEQ